MDRLKAMTIFVRIVEAGTLSAAADALGQSAASVVRSLAALEKHLGVRLLNRSTRKLALTAEGAEFLEWSRRVLLEFDEIEHQFDARRTSPEGLLRMTAPVEFGQRFVVPLVNKFLVDHPAIRVDLVLLDRTVDLLEEGMDLAIRIGSLRDSAMIARPLGHTRLVVCGSPNWLARMGPVEDPARLREVDCVIFTPQGNEWTFSVGGEEIVEVVRARLMTNHIRAAVKACTSGVGAARLLHYQIAEELADGRLVRLLRPFETSDIPVHLVYPHARLLSTRVRRFVDWAMSSLKATIPDPR